jgi:DNA invertase Pin-like site-specific DNA recombinase
MPRSKTPTVSLEEAKARFEEWLSVFAEFEHEILRERIAEGYAAAMRQAPIEGLAF